MVSPDTKEEYWLTACMPGTLIPAEAEFEEGLDMLVWESYDWWS